METAATGAVRLEEVMSRKRGPKSSMGQVTWKLLQHFITMILVVIAAEVILPTTAAVPGVSSPAALVATRAAAAVRRRILRKASPGIAVAAVVAVKRRGMGVLVRMGTLATQL